MDADNFQTPIPPLNPSVLSRFAQAAHDWKSEGALWVDLPWQVPEDFTRATRPLFCHGKDVQTPHGTLLASGEQAFLWLDSQRLLPDICMVGWTPCFRDEAVLDGWHQYSFIKLEAYLPIASDVDAEKALDRLACRARAHFERWSGQRIFRRNLADGSIDLELNEHEIGSYGVRSHPTIKGRRYAYGTVLAEPRFSMAMEASRQV